MSVGSWLLTIIDFLVVKEGLNLIFQVVLKCL